MSDINAHRLIILQNILQLVSTEILIFYTLCSNCLILIVIFFYIWCTNFLLEIIKPFLLLSTCIVFEYLNIFYII